VAVIGKPWPPDAERLIMRHVSRQVEGINNVGNSGASVGHSSIINVHSPNLTPVDSVGEGARLNF